MRTACIELAKYGITVNAVLPGSILTEGLNALGPDLMRGDGLGRLAGEVPFLPAAKLLPG